MAIGKKIKLELQNIKHQIRDDIEVYFRCEDSGGYFAVPQLVLSMVDYLGALHSGKGKDSKSEDAVSFMKTFFPEKYHSIGGILYHSLRHGTIHERRPKHPQISGLGKISWRLDKEGAYREQHLTPLRFINRKGKSRKVLLVVLPQLVDDLKQAIGNFEKVLEKDVNLRKNFGSSLRKVLKPESETDVMKRSRYINPNEFTAIKDLFKNAGDQS